MVLRAVERDAEASGDLFVRQAAADEGEDFAFARSQCVSVVAAHRDAIFARVADVRTTRNVGEANGWAVGGLGERIGYIRVRRPIDHRQRQSG